MPRQANSFVENNFTKGLITEATGLNFPEQAVTETSNCVFDERGSVERRRGIDFESGFETLAATVTDKALSSYLWRAAAGDGNNEIIVTQIGTDLYFYLLDGVTASGNQFDTVNITSFLPGGSTVDPSEFECQFAAGKGYLFVSSPAIDSFYVTYDPDALSVSTTEIELEVRDFEGVQDGLRVDERPAALSDAHSYNLHNQGWNVGEVDVAGGGVAYPLTEWDSLRSDFPNNADIWWVYRSTGGEYSSAERNHDYGNSPAPKGHFVLNYYNQNRNTEAAINPLRTWSGLTTTTSGFNRASTIAFFAGRVWYAGVRGSGYSNRVLFSQIIERDAQIGQCYQQNDPTSEASFDLLPSDGGTILIPDSGTIVKLFAFEDALLVFATNGCWKIAGSEGIGFRANDYSIVKISSVPALTEASFVDVGGLPLFWNEEGIYAVRTGDTGSTQLVSVTDTAIKRFYDDIPLQSKRYAKGAYNRRTRVVSWVYRSTEVTTDTDNYFYDSILNLNTLSNAFYPWTLDVSDVSIHGIVVCRAGIVESSLEAVTTGLGDVTDGSLDTVYGLIETDETSGDVTKFFVSNAGTVTFADDWFQGYKDWFTLDDTGTDYDSTFATGYKVHGNGSNKAQPTYINLFFRTEDNTNAIDFRSLWQYATSGNTGRWSTAQRIVTDSVEYSYTRKRIKSRGSGTAYQFKVESVSGEPFDIIGWSVFETINAQP